jgi:arabinan endo-1,5-alpha-L-arabinosidase
LIINVRNFKRYTMKRIIGILIFPLLLTYSNSCTDVLGDGMYTVIWEGSEVPQDSCYRNPVWDPDLSFPTVLKAAVGYYAFGADNEWSPGLDITAPVLSSSDLMNWRLRGSGFDAKPDWSEGKITAVSAGFAKTKGVYYLFYALGNEGIGMSVSKAPQGPFTDLGLLINAASVGLSECNNPLFYAFGSKGYVFYQGGDGVYGQELLLSKTELATLKGDKFKVTGTSINSIYLFKRDNYYYLFGGVDEGTGSRITLGRANNVQGPFLDKNGDSLMDGEGMLLLKANPDDIFSEIKHVGGVFEDANADIWILYQATDLEMPLLSSGADRHPMMLNKIDFDESGWPVKVFEAKGGWNHPKFAN